MSASSVQLVCFDLGRVLIRLCDGREDAAREAGIELPALDPDGWARWQATLEAYESGKLDTPRFFRQIATISGLSDDEHDRLLAAWLRGPQDGAEALLDEINRAAIQSACLSNTNDHHWRLMTDPDGPHGLPLDLLDYRFASHRIGHCKPEPGIYRHVEQATGVAGESILFFDDMPENVEAAQRRGWQAVRVENVHDAVPELRRHLCDHGVL